MGIRVRPQMQRSAGRCAQLAPVGAAATVWLLHGAATHLEAHARLSQARPLAERALAVTESVYSPEHPAVIALLTSLGGIWQDLGEPERARPLAERAAHLAQTVYGPRHPAFAACLTNLAAIMFDLGAPAQARLLAEQAVAIDEAAYGPADPAVTAGRGDLAGIGETLDADTAWPDTTPPVDRSN